MSELNKIGHDWSETELAKALREFNGESWCLTCKMDNRELTARGWFTCAVAAEKLKEIQ